MKKFHRLQKLGLALGLAALCLAAVVERAAAQGEPPLEWALGQNDPNPFCGSRGESTEIQVTIVEPCYLYILIFSPDRSHVVWRSEDVAFHGAGWAWIHWDGKDNHGEALADGLYPYEVEVSCLVLDCMLYSASRTAQIDCTTPVSPVRWGSAKRLFR
jgi:hypothetical protein